MHGVVFVCINSDRDKCNDIQESCVLMNYTHEVLRHSQPLYVENTFSMKRVGESWDSLAQSSCFSVGARNEHSETYSLDLVKEKGSNKIIFFSPWGSLGVELQVKVTQEYAH